MLGWGRCEPARGLPIVCSALGQARSYSLIPEAGQPPHLVPGLCHKLACDLGEPFPVPPQGVAIHWSQPSSRCGACGWFAPALTFPEVPQVWTDLDLMRPLPPS